MSPEILTWHHNFSLYNCLHLNMDFIFVSVISFSYSIYCKFLKEFKTDSYFKRFGSELLMKSERKGFRTILAGITSLKTNLNEHIFQKKLEEKTSTLHNIWDLTYGIFYNILWYLRKHTNTTTNNKNITWLSISGDLHWK